MLAAKIIFWVSLFVIFYSYVGYGILIWVLAKVKYLFFKQPSTTASHTFTPDVTLVIAAFNEASFIRKKIENSLELDYPAGKLKFLFVADGSSDETVDIIKEYPQIELYYKPEREGKSMAINRIIPFVKSQFIVFSDANTLLNKDCIKEIIKHYQDSTIGAVAGEKIVMTSAGDGFGVAGAGEGLYWKYESFLKKQDARFYSVVGAAGELFSIRTSLFEPVNRNVLLDDFIISMKICKKGYRVMYEPNAYATEAPSFSLKEEQKRKIRISAGGWQSVFMLIPLLNIFKYGKLSFQYISHRVLRWIVCPWLLPVLLITNLFLVFTNEPIYIITFFCQCLFYVAAFIGWLFAQQNQKVKLFYIAYYFVFMNLALYLGFIRFLNKTQTVLWDKAKRSNE